MKAFLQLYFLQVLSHNLIASIWQMALLWLATIFLFKLFRLSAAQKFNIAFTAQITGFCLFVYNCIHTYNFGVGNIIVSKTSNNILLNINSVLTILMPYIGIIYLCIVLFKLIKLCITYKDSKHLTSYGLQKISADKRIFVQQMCELFSLRKKVSIYLSGKIICPLTIGFFKPVILIPLAAINQLTTEQMEAVILHELAHIKRADYLLFLLQSIIEKFFFFNIFSLMLSEIIERERENSCDDWVLQFRYNAQHYAEALFKLGRIKALPVLSMPFTGKKQNLLLSRVKRILHNSQNKVFINLQSVLSPAFSLLFIVGFLISTGTKPVAQKAENISVNTIQKHTTLIAGTSGNNISASIKKETNEAKNNSTEKKISSDKNVAERKQSNHQPTKTQSNFAALKQNYIVQVYPKLDSLYNAVPQIKDAVNSQVVVTSADLRKVISYQNFKQIENMLAASGDSINVTETTASKDSYQKEITITAKDKNGNEHIYTVIVQLYQ
ncbi:MAG: M56 family metallopeptidase [Parafilimonas sp.]